MNVDVKVKVKVKVNVVLRMKVNVVLRMNVFFFPFRLLLLLLLGQNLIYICMYVWDSITDNAMICISPVCLLKYNPCHLSIKALPKRPSFEDRLPTY